MSKILWSYFETPQCIWARCWPKYTASIQSIFITSFLDTFSSIHPIKPVLKWTQKGPSSQIKTKSCIRTFNFAHVKRPFIGFGAFKVSKSFSWEVHLKVCAAVIHDILVGSGSKNDLCFWHKKHVRKVNWIMKISVFSVHPCSRTYTHGAFPFRID